jgi:hypothetical protein
MTPNFQQFLQLTQQVQTQVSQLQTELRQRTVTCSSGGGMVTATVTADGTGKIRSIKIDPAVAGGGDVEMLEDLVLAAVAEAQNRAQQVYDDEMKKFSGGFGFPFSLPEF